MPVTDDVRTILLCYDGSDRAGHAVSVAAKLFPGAHAHVLNVWEPLERIVARYSALGPYFGDGVGDADAGIDTAALRSSVWEAVVEAADALDAEVIITGTRSLHGVREVLSNTLSHALLQNSKRPVLAIPAGTKSS